MSRYETQGDLIIDRGMLKAGAALIGAGAFIAMAGAAVCSTAIATGLRRHVLDAGLPPSELALHHWRRAKSAAQAGADSWRVQVPAQATRQSQPRASVS
jgi:hypothetical protein